MRIYAAFRRTYYIIMIKLSSKNDLSGKLNETGAFVRIFTLANRQAAIVTRYIG